jgi:MipA family protein
VPIYIHESEHLYLRADRAGLKFDSAGDRRFGLFLSHRFESHPVNSVPSALSGMSVRVPQTDLGASYEERFAWGSAFAEVLRDVSGNSHGAELRLGISHERRIGSLGLAPYFMLAARDARLNDYYYGVLPSEVSTVRPAYRPGGGANATLGLNARYDLTDRWHFLAGVSATRWSAGVRASPIVEDRVLLSAFGAFAYEFVPTPRKEEPEHGPLTFKILHGRSTDCNLLPIMELRCRSIATDDRTSVDALHIGWPFIERPHGWPVAIAWYAGILRHAERGLQADFWQLDVYLKAFYWGFPWSDRVRTRIGFGGGLSFAEAVPFVEARDQAERGRNVSKLLQYLDPTIDVSVGDLVGSKSLRETYFGLGVSHRSGIFGMAKLFANVNGGSNYIYSYLEWRM